MQLVHDAALKAVPAPPNLKLAQAPHTYTHSQSQRSSRKRDQSSRRALRGSSKHTHRPGCPPIALSACAGCAVQQSCSTSGRGCLLVTTLHHTPLPCPTRHAHLTLTERHHPSSEAKPCIVPAASCAGADTAAVPSCVAPPDGLHLPRYITVPAQDRAAGVLPGVSAALSSAAGGVPSSPHRGSRC